MTIGAGPNGFDGGRREGMIQVASVSASVLIGNSLTRPKFRTIHSMSDVIRILKAAEVGDRQAAAELLPLVYDELRNLAAVRMAAEVPGHTLDATALVHEAYLRLVGPTDDKRWDGRGHFFAAAAESMRRILVESARRKGRLQHGGKRRRIELTDFPCAVPPDDLLALDEALCRLAEQDPAKAEVVKLRYFAGMTVPEVAGCLCISVATAERHWAFARTWLYSELNDCKE